MNRSPTRAAATSRFGSYLITDDHWVLADWVNSRRPVTTWLASASDSDLLEPRPSHLGGSRSAGKVMTIPLDEQIHHGAEIALLRDLYRRFGAGPRPLGRSLEGGSACGSHPVSLVSGGRADLRIRLANARHPVRPSVRLPRIGTSATVSAGWCDGRLGST
jgi:hypothetical protein